MGQNIAVECRSSSCSSRCEDWELSRNFSSTGANLGDTNHDEQNQTLVCGEDKEGCKGLSSMTHRPDSAPPSAMPSSGNAASAQLSETMPQCNVSPVAAETETPDIPGASSSSGYREEKQSEDERQPQRIAKPPESSAGVAANPQDSFEDTEIEPEAKTEKNEELARQREVVQGAAVDTKPESKTDSRRSGDEAKGAVLQDGAAHVVQTMQFRAQSGLSGDKNAVVMKVRNSGLMKHGTAGFDNRESRSVGESVRMSGSGLMGSGIIGSGFMGGTASVIAAKPFPKRPIICKISQACWNKLEELFKKMDADGSNQVTYEEAYIFFKGAFNKFSCEAMFNEVDVDKSGQITAEEFMAFWVQVRSNGYSDQDILDEVELLLDGGTWVDWKDGRDTTQQQKITFPKRPLLCAVSRENWTSLQKLFTKLDSDKQMVVTRENALDFFQKGGYASVSTDAMFNEVDVAGKGVITADDWMKFWRQVRASGYTNKQINEEVKSLVEGNVWVDWLDGRRT